VVASALIALIPLATAASRPHLGPATGPAPGDGGSAQTAPLTAWLEGHGVTYAVSGYWDASIVTLQSGGRVAIRTFDIRAKPHGTGQQAWVHPWETNALWYKPSLHDARWAIADTEHSRYTVDTYEKLFGKPEATYRVGSWIVLEYRANLLTEIQQPVGP
jgi:hypothetical protein